MTFPEDLGPKPTLTSGDWAALWAELIDHARRISFLEGVLSVCETEAERRPTTDSA